MRETRDRGKIIRRMNRGRENTWEFGLTKERRNEKTGKRGGITRRINRGEK